MKKLLGALVLMLSSSLACAAEGGFPLEHAPDRINNLVALQNGARLFVNYCLNCHSASSMRYNRLKDIGLTDVQIRDNLLFTGEKVGDLMTIAMAPKDAKAWFGAAPPDLSVIARAKSSHAGTGADYIYTYLRAYYRDTSKATGWNNLVFPNVGMPHVLWERQGPRELTTTTYHPAHAEAPAEGAKPAAGHGKAWEKVTTVYDVNGIATSKTEALTGYMGGERVETRFSSKDPVRTAAFDNDVGDLVAFMSYIAEPAQRERTRLGVWVLLFLAIFAVIAWRLNAVFWKDIK